MSQPRPRVPPLFEMMRGRVISATVNGDKNADAAIRSAVQNHLAVDREIVRGGKESGVSRNSIHAIRSWIVNLATQPYFTFCAGVVGRVAEITQLTATFFRRRNAGFQRRDADGSRCCSFRSGTKMFFCAN